MVRQLSLTNTEAGTVYLVQLIEALLKAWVLIGQWRVDSAPNGIQVLLNVPWAIGPMNIIKSITQLTTKKPGTSTATSVISWSSWRDRKKSKIFPTNATWESQLQWSVFMPRPVQTSLKPQWEGGSCPLNTIQPTNQRLDGMTTASSLWVCLSSQAAECHWRLPTQTLAAGADYLTCMLMAQQMLS